MNYGFAKLKKDSVARSEDKIKKISQYKPEYRQNINTWEKKRHRGSI